MEHMGKLFLVPRFFFEQLGFEILWNQLMGPRNVLDWQLATIPASLNDWGIKKWGIPMILNDHVRGDQTAVRGRYNLPRYSNMFLDLPPTQ